MKRTILALAFLIISTFINAQERSLKSVYSYSYVNHLSRQISQEAKVNGSIVYLEHLISYQYDELTSDFTRKLNKQEFDFDGAGNLVEKVNYSWDNQSEEWTFSSKNTSTYDSDGNLIESISYGWNETDGQWLEQQKQVSSYDGYGNKESFSMYDFVAGQWDQILAFEYDLSYDSQSQLILSDVHLYNQGLWEHNTSIIYEYSNQGQLLTELTQTLEQGVWEDYFKIECTYDDQGFLIKWTNAWQRNGQWEFDAKKEYERDFSGKHLSDVHFNYQGGAWITGHKAEYNHDPLYSSGYTVCGDSLNEKVNDSYLLSKDQNNNWAEYLYLDYHYNVDSNDETDIETSVEELSELNVGVYPNPVSEKLIFDVETNDEFLIKLFSSNGSLVYIGSHVKKAELNVSAMSSGVYLYQLLLRGSVKVGKIIKE